MRATFDDPSLAGLGEDPSDILSDRHPYLQFNNARPSPRPGKGAKRERGARFANIVSRKQRTSRLTPGGLPQPPEVAGVEADARVPNVLQLMSGEEFNNHEIAGGLPQFHSPLQSPPTGTASTDTMPKGQLQAQGGGKPKNMAAGDRSTFGKPLGMPTDQGQPSPLAGLPHFAEGGDLPAGQTGVVGEQGEEEITATPGGGVQVTPLEQPAAQQPVTASPQLGTVADAIQHAAVAPRPPRDTAIAPQAAVPAPAPAKAPAPAPSTQSTQSTDISTPAPAAPAPTDADGLSPEGKQAMADIVNSYPMLSHAAPNPLDPALQPHGVHRALDVLAGLGTGILSLNPLAGMSVYHTLQDQAAERKAAAQPGYVSPQTQANIEAANKSIEPALTSATQMAVEQNKGETQQNVANTKAQATLDATKLKTAMPTLSNLKATMVSQGAEKYMADHPDATPAEALAAAFKMTSPTGANELTNLRNNFIDALTNRSMGKPLTPDQQAALSNYPSYMSLNDAGYIEGRLESTKVDAVDNRPDSPTYGKAIITNLADVRKAPLGSFVDVSEVNTGMAQATSILPANIANQPGVAYDAAGNVIPERAAAQPTEPTRTAGQASKALIEGSVADAENILGSPDAPTMFGPMYGRWNDFMTGKIGTGNDAFQRLRDDLNYIKTGVLRAHGMRSRVALGEMNQILNAKVMSPQLLQAGLDATKDLLAHYEEAAGLPVTPGAVPPPVNPPPGGQTSFTVTTPDGKVFKFKDQASADKFKKDAGIQ